MKKLMIGLAGVAAMTLGMASVAVATEKTKVCFVYVGSKTDGGWTQAHDIGRQELETYFGDEVETSFIENVSEGPQAAAVIERFARAKCDLIFTTSFGFMDQTLEVAAKFPDVKFEHATGYKNAANVASYNSRFYEGRYIQGQIAAKTSTKGVAGYIASFPIPEVVQGINAFTLGAQSVNPDFKLKVVWVNTWFDAGKEADAAKALIDQGVDILTQHTDSTGPMQVAAERGIKAFGQASDMISAGPNTQLTAIVDTWGAYYIKRTQAVMDGTWETQSSWDGLAEGILQMAPYTNMPDDIKAMAEATEAAIISGELHPFTGPVMKQDGSAWLTEGEIAEDGVLLGLNFYVQGVDDQLPQ